MTLGVWRPAVTRGALLLMESLWVYAFVAFLVASLAVGGKPSIFGAMAVVFGSFSISRFLQQRTDLDLGVLRIWGVVLSLLIFYVIVRVDFFGDWRVWDFSWADRLFNRTEATLNLRVDAFFGIPVLWAFWMRGVLRGQQHLGFEEVAGSFALGVMLIAGVELLQAGPDDTPKLVGIVAVPYIAVGLLAIGLSHAARADDEFTRSFTPTWLLAVGGAVAVLSLIALFFVLLDYGAAASLMRDVSLAVLRVLAFVIYYVTYPFVWGIERIMEGVRWIFENVWGGQRPQPAEDEPATGEQQEEEETARELPGWARVLSRVIVGGVFTTLLLGATALLFRRFAKRDDAESVKESMYQEGRLAGDLGGFLGNILGRLRPNLGFGGRADPARRLYYDVLSAAANRGIERRPGETPLELAPRIEATFGAGPPSKITHMFDDVRYGSLTPSDAEVERLRNEWDSNRRP